MRHTTVIIPNYNGMRFLPACFDALARQDDRNFRVLVVDNGSTDGSVAWLKERESDLVQVIYLPKNTGFTGAVNRGISASRTDYVLLLNNDTKVDHGFVGAMHRAISRDPHIFSVSARMIRMYEPELLDSAGDNYAVTGWAFNRGNGRSTRHYQKSGQVFSACAGAAIYRRKAFKEIGLFDDRHFAYLEDLDVGYRARIYGYRNEYCAEAVVWHAGSGTTTDGTKYSDFKVRLSARNNVYLAYKNMPLIQYAVNYLPMRLGSAVKQRYFNKIGLGKAYREGQLEGQKTKKLCHKVPFRWRHLGNYLKIEGRLLSSLVAYIYGFLARKLEEQRRGDTTKSKSG